MLQIPYLTLKLTHLVVWFVTSINQVMLSIIESFRMIRKFFEALFEEIIPISLYFELKLCSIIDRLILIGSIVLW